MAGGALEEIMLEDFVTELKVGDLVFYDSSTYLDVAELDSEVGIIEKITEEYDFAASDIQEEQSKQLIKFYYVFWAKTSNNRGWGYRIESIKKWRQDYLELENKIL